MAVAGGGHAFESSPELAAELELCVTGAEARDLVSEVRRILDC